MHNDFKDARPTGYAALTERYALTAIPNWHLSSVSMRASAQRVVGDGGVDEVYPKNYWPGDGFGDHLEFALKYDGVNLGILAALFHKANPADLVEYVRSKPTGKYARRAWFLYEFLTGKTLPLADLSQGNYVDLLEAGAYYRLTARRMRRQRINDNLLGGSAFCPTIRRTAKLQAFEAANLAARCGALVARYPAALLERALTYLYTKETKSSFAIESERPSTARLNRFIDLLRRADDRDYCAKAELIELQRRILDPRFAAADYRQTQVYVGESVAPEQEVVHFIGARAADLPALMAGLIATHQRMDAAELSPVIHAAAISYGFVFLHPFEDGNGRLHRFLIHNILARRGFLPRVGGDRDAQALPFPVSAAMLNNPRRYDASLEAFSRPLMPLVDYRLDGAGEMTVHNHTALHYRYPDLTPQAEALFGFIERTIDDELMPELAFLASFDAARKAIREIVDMPDRLIDLFVYFCRQNQGRLSARKQATHFGALSNEEIAAMELAVQSALDSAMDV